ncbi:MAG: ABC transporter ATP-binding protein [Oscillospiraceae bacterium]|nr:ABC transporter ATP-binding protein [Oscillospiraceae bacterium]
MKPNKEHLLLRLALAAKPIYGWLLLGAVIDILAVITAVIAPNLLGDIIQTLYDYWEAGAVGAIPATIVHGLVLLTLVYGLSSILSYANMRLMNQVVSRHFTCDLRIAISEKIKRLPVRYVDQTPVGDILRRMTDDVGEMGGYLHQIFDTLVKGLFQLVLIAVAMFLEDPVLAAFVVVMMPFSLWLSSKIAGLSEKHYDDFFDQSGKLSELVEEAFSNYPTSKAYNLEDYLDNRHGVINEEVRKSSIRANFTGSIVQPLIRLTNAVAFILINLIGGWLIVSRGVGVGVVVTIVLYARQFASPLEQMSYGFSQMNRVKAASRRVFEILDLEEDREPKQESLLGVQGRVEFRNVDFSYKAEEPLIRNLNLEVHPGQKVAIVGPTGAGKTTIVNLLMRFYDPDSGSILLDGRDTASLGREQIRECFGMVLQDTWLFRGTIRENLAYGKPDASDKEIREACRKTHCDHFIRTMPMGYDTVIGEDTTNLSGGQKQLLTIARALLANKPLLILDEATSNVDTRTELLIQKAMDTLMEGKTCFVIAHRLSTIVDSDVILVLDKGQIVEQGTHRELLARKGFYYTLYTSQYAA